MTAYRHRRSRRLASQSGYSLPELLVGITIALMVAAGAATVLMIAVRSQPRAGDRSAQIQQGRTMVDGISRDVREAETVFSPTASGFEILTYVQTAGCGAGGTGPARLCRVSYSCAADSCTRTERNADGSGSAPPRVVVEGITGPNVFSYQGPPANPSYVGIELLFPNEDGGESVTLADGAELRNHVELAAGA